ncbi:hypothetical protein J729_0377 [Acinetobacter baumannii 929679-598]|nr:hypothetical protein J729_0377 [Acinetobacter baumannii 929679-598]
MNLRFDLLFFWEKKAKPLPSAKPVQYLFLNNSITKPLSD